MLHAPAPKTVILCTSLAFEGPTGVNTYMRLCTESWHAAGIAWGIASPWHPGGWRRWLRGGGRRLFARLPESLHRSLWLSLHTRLLVADLRQVRTRLAPTEAAQVTVYAQSPSALIAAARALPAVRRVLICHFNGSEADEHRFRFGLAPDSAFCRRLERQETEAIRLADAVVVPSHWLANILTRRHMDQVNKITVIPNCSPTVCPISASTVHWDLLAVGTLEPRKNQRYLLDIAHACRRLGQPLRIGVVGDGTDLPALQDQAQRLGIAQDVTFLGRQDARSVMPQARALIHVAIAENLPITLIEAMANSLPVFVAPMGGIPDLVVPDTTGAFLPLDNAEAAARIVLTQLNDAAAMTAMATAAHERHRQYFTPDAVMPRLTRVLWPESA